MKVLIPGGAGYVGAMLVPWLLARGHRVTVYDTMLFGNGCLPQDNAHLKIIKGDVRDAKMFAAACQGHEAVIYLASISNNDVCEQHPDLAESVNVVAMQAIPRIATAAGIRRFIYASSVAGYGASDKPSTEEQALGHPTPYTQGKLCGEGSTRGQSEYTIIRSASVCGYSPRMRFDLTVNMMVHDAVRRGVITVNGGEQKRSHIHIQDLCDFYALIIDLAHERSAGQVFNVVAENMTVMETAEIVAEATGARIEVLPRSDNRSYSVDGTKAREVLGFKPKRTVEQAVLKLKAHFDSGYWKDSLTNPRYMNVVEGAF